MKTHLCIIIALLTLFALSSCGVGNADDNYPYSDNEVNPPDNADNCDDIDNNSYQDEQVKVSQNKNTITFHDVPTAGMEVRLSTRALSFEIMENAPSWAVDSQEAYLITVYCEDGEEIQQIEGSWLLFEMFQFGDFNFDGYVDFGLPRQSEHFELLFVSRYYFLWDSNIRGFVLNEQLTDIVDNFSTLVEFANVNLNNTEEQDLRWPAISPNIDQNLLNFFVPINRSGLGLDLPAHLSDFNVVWSVSAYYKYVDGEFVLVKMVDRHFDWEETWTRRTYDAATGELTIDVITWQWE
ncbi:MAG: hypothetical protein FWB93_01895 [Oscillospiraceae bacterium]|nr:hypothetical protein [Oscillospiraceae bacterium]